MPKYEPNIVNVEGRLFENYRRETLASDEIKQSLDLSTTEKVYTNIPIASIPEYWVLEAGNIQRNQIHTWSLERIGQDVSVKSVYIDTPNADVFTFEIIRQSQVVFTFKLSRNDTPYEFPPNPIPCDLQIRIDPSSNISLLRIILAPAIIMETFPNDEYINYTPEEQTL